nr:CapA family protein [Desulfobacter postgatei]
MPFSAVTLGNNHMFDFGVEGFQQTVRLLDRHGIAGTCAGMTKAEAQAPLMMEAKGVRIAIVNISEGEDLTAAGPGPGVAGWDIKGACTRIKKRRNGRLPHPDRPYRQLGPGAVRHCLITVEKL